jgi:surface-anchored protein
MKKATHGFTVVLATLVATCLTANGQVRFLAHGHTDLSINYDAVAKAWDFHVGSDTLGVEFGTNDVVLKVKAAAQSTVPSDPHFAFLGTPGAPVWILPKVQNEELLYLGYGGSGIPTHVFVGEQVKVTLKNVTGPGDFFSYDFDLFGNPKVLFNTRDGISTNDVATVQAGGDYHLNWAFSKPGVYKVALEVSGTLLAGNQTTSSSPVTFTFDVGDGPKTLSTGHTDLSLVYTPDTDAWDVHVGSDTLMEQYDTDDTILLVKPEAQTTVTNDTKFAFLGNPGDPIWILPKVQNENLLYLGYGADGIPTNVFVGDQVTVTLKNVTGPGDFFSYDFDIFGTPKVLFNTRDGISTNDFVNVHSGGDAHLNWAFTQPGTYTVTLEVSGTLIQGNKTVSSGPVTYTFVVQTVLTIEHTDLQAAYDPTNLLQLVVLDVNHTIAYKSNEVNLVVAEAAKTTIPDGTPLGPGGSSLWIIPASQDPNLLYLGTSAEPPTSAGRPGIPSGVFNGNLTLRLISVDGPGQFIVWQTPGGSYDFIFDTRDGITDADSHTVILGSHEHFNWGFTINGVYHVSLQFSGQLAGSTNISSPITPITFNVLPLLTNAPPSDIQLSDAKLPAGGAFTFNVAGAASGTIEVQASEDLNQWASVLTNAVTSTSSKSISVPPDPTKSQRFFRVLAH